MATPALRLLRRGLPGAFIGGLVRPGLDDLLAGTTFFDELHVDRARGVMGPKLVASKIRPRQYDTALLLTNSFSTALITRLAFIPRRIGYDRDGRWLLLTDRLKPEKTGVLGSGGFAVVSAVDYYLRAAQAVLDGRESGSLPPAGGPIRLELAATPAQDAAAAEVLQRCGITPGERYAVLNPGGNNPAKRWPADRFAQVGAVLVRDYGLRVLVNGSPLEAELCARIVQEIGAATLQEPGPRAHSLPAAGITLGALKGVVRGAALMLTNDTGPRHIAAAFGVPTICLFGPTDPRWTTLPPGAAPMVEVVSNPALPPAKVADDHPEECRIERIEVGTVLESIGRAQNAGLMEPRSARSSS